MPLNICLSEHLLCWWLLQVAGYKVKCMLAEPKTKRGRPEAQDVYSPMHQVCANKMILMCQQLGYCQRHFGC